MRIAMLGAGAVGGYVGGHLAAAGYDVTLIDFWHEHVEAIRSRGLELTGMTEAERLLVKPKTLHLHEVSGLSREAPIDVAFLSMKSYDTEWIATLARPYLSSSGFIVSLQNCLNEETIARVVGWGRTMGCIAARIGVELYEPGRIRRQEEKTPGNFVFRVGELHGRVTERAERVAEMLRTVDGAKVTTNIWGERWSKLCRNSMRGGISASTGLSGKKIFESDVARPVAIRLGAEAAKIGRALGFELEKIGKVDAALMASALDDQAAFREVEKQLVAEASGSVGGKKGALQRPSLGQDMLKGRRTEIDFMNGFIAAKGDEIGIPAPTHAMITALVKRVERGEIKPDPANLAELRLAA